MSSRSIKDSAELQNIFPHTRLHLNDNNFLISDIRRYLMNQKKNLDATIRLKLNTAV